MVTNMEAEYGVELLEGHHRFITEIGDGGAGPYCEIPTIHETDNCFFVFNAGRGMMALLKLSPSRSFASRYGMMV